MASESISDLEATFDKLWPLPRSITGDGLRASLDILGDIMPLRRIEIPTGTRVFDWTIPPEWIVRQAYVVTPAGDRILDFAENNLHLVGYSIPFRGTISLAELDQHLHSLPERPQALPYVTSYYQPRWGFCAPHAVRQTLTDGLYEVVVDTDLVDGALSIGDAVLEGQNQTEVLFSSYLCHPSMANNELSGPLALAYLYRRIAAIPDRRLTYRFVIAPETIGSLAYLNHHDMINLAAGYVLTCCGIPAPFTYKQSRRGDTLADRVAIHILDNRGDHYHDLSFRPDYGSDERQYCSPGFNLPVGSLMTRMYATYPEYHTSDDNKSLVSFQMIQETIDVCEQIVHTLEYNQTYKRTNPYGEPQLSRHDLYPTLSVANSTRETSALMWVLSYSDGEHDLLWITERSDHSIEVLAEAAKQAHVAGLLS